MWGKVIDNIDHGFLLGDDWAEVYRLAEEQSTIGLIADSIDRFKVKVSGFNIPQEWALQFIGHTLQIEKRNRESKHPTPI